MENSKHYLGYPIVILITIGIMLFFKGCDSVVKDSSKPKEIISLEQAKELYDNYTNKRACLIEYYETSKDTSIDYFCGTQRSKIKNEYVPVRSFQLSKRYLNNYFNYIDSLTKTYEVRVTGYQIYLANYSENSDLDPGRNTIFITPTAKNSISGKNEGFTFRFNNETRKMEQIFIDKEFELIEIGDYKSDNPKHFSASLFSYGNILQLEDAHTIINHVGGDP